MSDNSRRYKLVVLCAFVLGLVAVGTAVVFWPGEGTEDSSRKSISDPDALGGNRISLRELSKRRSELKKRRWRKADRCAEELDPGASQAKYNEVLGSYFEIDKRMRTDPEIKKWLDSLDREKCARAIVKALKGDDRKRYNQAADLAAYYKVDGAVDPIIALLTERLEGEIDDDISYGLFMRSLGRLAAAGNERAKDFLIEAASIDYWDKTLKWWTRGKRLYPREKRIHLQAVSVFFTLISAIRLVPCRETMQALKFPEGAEENVRCHAGFTYMMIRNFLQSGDSIEEWRKAMEKHPTHNKYGDHEVYIERHGTYMDYLEKKKKQGK